MSRQLTLTALDGVPEVAPGADLVALTLAALAQSNATLAQGDVVVFASKIVAKAEGRYVALVEVRPSARAIELAAQSAKDARVVELILAESSEVMRCVPGTLIVRHRLGCVLANAGIDESNLVADVADKVLLLPLDPDASAAQLRAALRERTGIDVPVLIIDSLGRAWRQGVIGTAIGVSGLAALVDLRGTPDRRGRALKVTEVGAADELAAAASLVMGQADEGTPIVLARGVPYARREARARELLRPLAKDLFR
jgi:coenzyme F420-0:L-glutamate ligase / coenzyme F420-1:gamma-L-glutamate ligase